MCKTAAWKSSSDHFSQRCPDLLVGATYRISGASPSWANERIPSSLERLALPRPVVGLEDLHVQASALSLAAAFVVLYLFLLYNALHTDGKDKIWRSGVWQERYCFCSGMEKKRIAAAQTASEGAEDEDEGPPAPPLAPAAAASATAARAPRSPSPRG